MNKPKELSQTQREQLTQKLKDQLEQRQEIIFSYLYGSFVEGEYFRDIDVAVYVDEQIVPEDKALEYTFKLADILESETKLPVDVRALNYTTLGFKYHVTTGKVLTCQDDDLRAYVVGKIWTLYFDQLPTVKRFLKEMVER
jgi:hypothetical protein